MSKGWKVVWAIFLAALLLGAVCIAVGIFTGADYSTIYSKFDVLYQVEMWLTWVKTNFDTFLALFVRLIMLPFQAIAYLFA